MRLPQGFISFSPSLPIFLQLTSPAEGYRQGDRRVSERSTLPFISPSPVSSGLTSLLSLSLYTHLVLMVATRGKVTRERPTLPGSPLHPRRFTSLLHAYVAQLRWHAPNPRNGRSRVVALLPTFCSSLNKRAIELLIELGHLLSYFLISLFSFGGVNWGVKDFADCLFFSFSFGGGIRLIFRSIFRSYL